MNKETRNFNILVIYDLDIEKILVSTNNVSFGKKGFKYFFGYKDHDYKIKPLCIMLQKVSGYAENFATKYVSSFY